jgi:thiamine-phosphate pyrophosphorylase
MHPDETREARLIIEIETGSGALERLTAVLAAVPVASLIVSTSGSTASDVAPLVAAGQERGVAVLVASDVDLARAVGADGVHLAQSDDSKGPFEAARAALGGRAIVGGDAGRSKHEAMTLGDLGADYVAFGVPGFVKDRATAFERQRDLIEWWAEIFEIPSVAMDVATREQAVALAEAGADFVCLSLASGLAVADAVDRARDWSAGLVGLRGGDA